MQQTCHQPSRLRHDHETFAQSQGLVACLLEVPVGKYFLPGSLGACTYKIAKKTLGRWVTLWISICPTLLWYRRYAVVRERTNGEPLVSPIWYSKFIRPDCWSRNREGGCDCEAASVLQFCNSDSEAQYGYMDYRISHWSHNKGEWRFWEALNFICSPILV